MLKILFALILILTGCSVLSRGYYNEDFKFVPKRPNYKLARIKFNYDNSSRLDTIGFYELSEIYYNGGKTFDITWPRQSWPQSNVVVIKFNSNGTCYYVGIPYEEYPKFKKFSFIRWDYLKLSNLEYYRFTSSRSIEMEVFANTPGLGSYMIKNYNILNNGNSISNYVEGVERVYSLKKFE